MKVFLSLTLLVGLTLAEPPVYRQQSQNERNTYYFARQQAEVETPVEPEAAGPYQPSGWKPDGPAFELPQKQQQQQVAPAAPQKQYGAPQVTPQKQYGAPQVAPQKQYGAPQAAPQHQYGTPQAAPQQQYRTPQAAPQQQFRAFPAPQRRFPAPAAPQIQYASTPQQQYGAPSVPQQQYGAPPQQSYGPPESQTTTEEPTSIDSEESTTLPSGTESQAEPVESVNELAEDGEVDDKQKQAGEYYVALPDGRLQRIQYMSTQDIEAMKYFARIQAENVEPLRGPIYAYSPLQKLEFAQTNLQVAVPNPYVQAAPVLAIRENVRDVVGKSAPEKLRQVAGQRQPLAAEVRYESPSAVVGSSASNAEAPGSSYLPYNANYQTPNQDQRYLISF